MRRKEEISDLSESSSRVDESSPPRDSPSPESSSSSSDEDQDDQEHVSDHEDEFVRRRQYCRRGSNPEREIDEEDTETAELQTNLRKYSSKNRLTLSDGDGHESHEHEEVDTNNNDRRSRRGGSNPEREIIEEDTETAEFQSNLRKLAAGKHKSELSQSSPNISDSPGDKSDSGDSEPGARRMPGAKNKTIFRPSSMRGRGRGGHGLRRSRTWQGFTSGLRYESVSDAGMPPPPSSPPNTGNGSVQTGNNKR